MILTGSQVALGRVFAQRVVPVGICQLSAGRIASYHLRLHQFGCETGHQLVSWSVNSNIWRHKDFMELVNQLNEHHSWLRQVCDFGIYDALLSFICFMMVDAHVGLQRELLLCFS